MLFLLQIITNSWTLNLSIIPVIRIYWSCITKKALQKIEWEFKNYETLERHLDNFPYQQSNISFHISIKSNQRKGRKKGFAVMIQERLKRNLSTRRCSQFLLLIFFFFFILIHHINVCCSWNATTHRFSSTFLSRCSRCGSVFILWYSRSFSFSSFSRCKVLLDWENH